MVNRTIVRVTPKRSEAQKEAREINVSLKERGIKREAYVCNVSKSYVQKLTRPGYPIPKKNYGICMRDKK